MSTRSRSTLRRTLLLLLRTASVLSLIACTGLWIASYRNWTFYYKDSAWNNFQITAVDGVVRVSVGRMIAPGGAGVPFSGVSRWDFRSENPDPYAHDIPTLIRVGFVEHPAYGNIISQSVKLAYQAAFGWVIAGVVPFSLLIILPLVRRHISGRFDAADLETSERVQ